MKNILFALAAISILASCSSSFTKPTFEKMSALKLRPPSLKGEIVLTANAIFNNPNAFGLDIDKMELIVKIDGKKVADITQDITAIMAAKTDFSLPLKIKVPAKEVFDNVKAGLFAQLFKNKKVTVEINGDMIVSKAGVKMTVPFNTVDIYEF